MFVRKASPSRRKANPNRRKPIVFVRKASPSRRKAKPNRRKLIVFVRKAKPNRRKLIVFVRKPKPDRRKPNVFVRKANVLVPRCFQWVAVVNPRNDTGEIISRTIRAGAELESARVRIQAREKGWYCW